MSSISNFNARFAQCGLNADWSVRAWHVGPGPEANLTDGDFLKSIGEQIEGRGVRLFRSTTRVQGTAEPFVDWYNGVDEADARKLWDEDCHRYGTPMDKTTVEFVECDPNTLKPLNGAPEAFTIEHATIDGQAVWQWRIKGARVETGGICATWQDAVNDARIALKALQGGAPC